MWSGNPENSHEFLWIIYLCVWHDSFICVTWLIHEWWWWSTCIGYLERWRWAMNHDSFLCVTWLIHMHDLTRSRVSHDSCTCVIMMWHGSFIRVTCLIYICTEQGRPLNVSSDQDTRWQKCTWCLTLRVSFRKRATNYGLYCGNDQ